jgi:hypothetical protein
MTSLEDEPEFPPMGAKLRIDGQLYKITGFAVVYPDPYVILDPMEPTRTRGRVRMTVKNTYKYQWI